MKLNEAVLDRAAKLCRERNVVIPTLAQMRDPAKVPAMRGVPVRGYHGDQDTVVPLAPHVACVEALRAAGGTASLTVYPGVGHDSWTPAYNDPGLLPWLLSQRQT